MRIYFAHSFDGSDPSKRMLLDDPATAPFIWRMRRMSIEVIDPAEAEIPMSFPSSRFEYCLQQIKSADIVVVVATERLGVGVGAEMMYAHVHEKRVFVVCPSNSYYRTSDHGEEIVHAFVHGLSTRMFSTLDDCTSEIEAMCS